MSVYSDQHAFPSFLGLDQQLPDPVVVESIEVFEFDKTVLVRAWSQAGASGVAVCNLRALYLWPMLKELVIPAFVGRDARDLEQLVKDVYVFRSNYKYHGTPFWNCVAYVEAALFDLLGQVAGRSVGDLIGGAWRERVPIYLSCMKRDNSPEDEADRLQRRVEATGARAVKYKIGGRMRNNADSIPGRTEALIPLIRRRLGDAATLYVDANGSYDAAHAIAIGRQLEAFGYAWFEEPCPFEQYEETKIVADALTIPVAGGEQDCNLALFRMMIRDRYVDMIQPDLMYNGGLIRALRVARMAAEAGMNVTPHSPKHNPELATLLHFASVVRNTGPFMEFPVEEVRYDSWYAPHFVIEPGGFLRVPRGPGLGVTYDPAIWEKARPL